MLRKKSPLKKTILILMVALLCLTMLSACVPGPNEYEKTKSEEGKIHGFWSGLWHGIVAPIIFFVSLFTDNVEFYEVHNNGNWYNFGFIWGIGGLGTLVYAIFGRKRNSQYPY